MARKERNKKSSATASQPARIQVEYFLLRLLYIIRNALDCVLFKSNKHITYSRITDRMRPVLEEHERTMSSANYVL